MEPIAFYKRKRLLVTGSTGYLSTNLIRALAATDCHIIRLSRHGARFGAVNGRASVEEVTGDIAERETWERVLDGSQIVFHLAACTDYANNHNPPADLAINFIPMLHLLETCRLIAQQPVVLFSGTATQTGIPTRLPVDETHPDNPMTVYDLHKQMAENYLKYYAGQRIVRGGGLRLTNVYGPGAETSNPERGFLNIMIRKAMAGESLTIYGDGEYVRDFVYVDDVVNAFLLAVPHIDVLNARSFVIGSGRGYKLAESVRLVAERVAMKTGRRAPVVHINPPRPLLPIETRNFVADPSCFANATGWLAQVSLEEGIDRTIDYYLTGSASAA